MSKTTKNIIVVIALACVLGIVGIVLYCNWNAIVGTVTNNAYYTAEDLQNAYDEGYNDGINNETELTNQINYYINLVDELSVTKSKLDEQIDQLNATIENLEQQIAELEDANVNYVSAIAILQSEIETLKQQIEDLNTTIDYYKDYIEKVLGDENVLATFYYNGTVYYSEVVAVGSSVTGLVDPEDTTYITFNYWEVDGVKVEDVSNYPITENTTFEANITIVYDAICADLEADLLEIYSSYSFAYIDYVNNYLYLGTDSSVMYAITCYQFSSPISLETTVDSLLDDIISSSKMSFHSVSYFIENYYYTQSNYDTLLSEKNAYAAYAYRVGYSDDVVIMYVNEDYDPILFEQYSVTSVEGYETGSYIVDDTTFYNIYDAIMVALYNAAGIKAGNVRMQNCNGLLATGSSPYFD